MTILVDRAAAAPVVTREAVRRSDALPLAAILALALLLRLPRLTESLWFDELWSTRLYLSNVFTLGRTILFEVHPPFYWLFMFAWTSLFGDGEVSVRLPPLLAGLGSIALTYALGSRLVDRATGLLAALLLCLAPVHIWYSQEARPYSMIVFLVLASLLLFYRARDPAAPRLVVVAYFVALFCAVLTHYYVVSYVAALSLLALLRPGARRRILLIHGFVLACFFAFLLGRELVANVPTARGHLRAFTLPEAWFLFFNWYPLGNALWNVSHGTGDFRTLLAHPGLAAIQLFLFALFLSGVVLLVRAWRSGDRPDAADVLLYFAAAPGLVFVLTAVGFRNVYIERSLVVALPFFCIVMARGATGLAPRPVRAAAVVTVVAVWIAGLVAYQRKPGEFTVYKPNADWRAAAAYLHRAHAGRDREILFSTSPAQELVYYDADVAERKERSRQQANYRTWNVRGSLVALRNDYYAARDLFFASARDRPRLEIVNVAEDGFAKVLEELRQNPQVTRVHLLHDRAWAMGRPWLTREFGNPRATVRAALADPRLRLVERKDFRGITLYTFDVEGR